MHLPPNGRGARECKSIGCSTGMPWVERWVYDGGQHQIPAIPVARSLWWHLVQQESDILIGLPDTWLYLSMLLQSNPLLACHASQFACHCGLCCWPYWQCLQCPGLLHYPYLQGAWAHFGPWWVDMGRLSVSSQDVVCHTVLEACWWWAVMWSMDIQLPCVKSKFLLYFFCLLMILNY